VQRSTHLQDRRIKIVTITDAGGSAVPRSPCIQGEPPPTLRGLAADDLTTLNRILAQLVRAEN
jgi:DNA-binding MarR family transcriptional regulator